MGISNIAIKSLFHLYKEGGKFDAVITLGRQHFFTGKEELVHLAKDFGADHLVKDIEFPDPFSEPFFRALGANTTDSMDMSSYEGASVIHDLNLPVPQHMYEQYDLVFDGGTLEHVFQFPQAMKNCMQMVKQGGHLVSITPANNMLGHGFYQFSPELFYRVLSEENGFEMVKMFISLDKEHAKWYLVKDPNEVKSRVTLTNSAATILIIIARRAAVKEIFSTTPQQSDYAVTWKSKVEEDPERSSNQAVRGLYQKLVPVALRDRIWKLRYRRQHREVYTDDLGRHNPEHFIRTEF